MNVDELLDLMEETLEEGTAMPFSAGKRVVDVDKMRDIIDDVRANLPDEMRQSKKIVEDRERIVQDARKEADSIIKQAEDRAKVLTSDQEITKRAQKRAVEILTTAQNQSREISKSATNYCETILKNTEETLAHSIADIKNTRMNLRNATARGSRRSK
ncbi:ATPase [uncultured Gemmiger sp.]|uniref:ATPase n=1 Tax=uncultured Gemmiger sp. TaxID=1623490 RepID=UPI0025F4FA60|nr:ATPase [uncultured Gemmiger sp.]